MGQDNKLYSTLRGKDGENRVSAALASREKDVIGSHEVQMRVSYRKEQCVMGK